MAAPLASNQGHTPDATLPAAASGPQSGTQPGTTAPLQLHQPTAAFHPAELSTQQIAIAPSPTQLHTNHPSGTQPPPHNGRSKRSITQPTPAAELPVPILLPRRSAADGEVYPAAPAGLLHRDGAAVPAPAAVIKEEEEGWAGGKGDSGCAVGQQQAILGLQGYLQQVSCCIFDTLTQQVMRVNGHRDDLCRGFHSSFGLSDLLLLHIKIQEWQLGKIALCDAMHELAVPVL